MNLGTRWIGIALCVGATYGGPLSATAQDYELQVPLGLKAPKVPADNPMTAAKVALGRQLYFDPRLSADNFVRQLS